MNQKLTASQIIDALGGTSKTALLCEIKPPSVTGWRTAGIPKAQMKFLMLARPDVFGIETKRAKHMPLRQSGAAHA